MEKQKVCQASVIIYAGKKRRHLQWPARKSVIIELPTITC